MPAAPSRPNIESVLGTLADEVEGMGLQITTPQLEQLIRFRDLLAASAKEFNLTSLRDPEGIERRHLIESLAFGAFLQTRGLLDAHQALRLVDIGTGAGLPGIPLKIGWPRLQLTLLESVGKKSRFLEMARDALELTDVEVVEARAEDFGRDEAHRETYDLAVARAVAPLPVLLEYALPLLRRGGRLVAPKGSAAPSELAGALTALELLGGRVVEAVRFLPPHGAAQTVIVVEKVAGTPERYPRRAGIPTKRPL